MYIFSFKLTESDELNRLPGKSQRTHKIYQKIMKNGRAWAPAAGFVLLESHLSLIGIVDEILSLLHEDDFLFAADCGEFVSSVYVGHVWDDSGLIALLPNIKGVQNL